MVTDRRLRAQLQSGLEDLLGAPRSTAGYNVEGTEGQQRKVAADIVDPAAISGPRCMVATTIKSPSQALVLTAASAWALFRPSLVEFSMAR